MKSSRLLILSAFGGIACFSSLQMLAGRMPSSFVANTVDSLGGLYGMMLFGSGLFAVLSAFTRDLWDSPDNSILRSRWVVFLPALIGVIGVLHGYLSMASFYSALPEDITVPHNTVWATATVGALWTIAATAVVFAGRGQNSDSNPLTR